MTTEMTVPLLDLRAQYATIKREIDEAIRGVLKSQRFILGPEVASLEEEIASYCDARFAIGCASGSDAILLALMALNIGSGDQVICPSYTFFATAGSIARLGAVPVFADIDPVTYNVDAESVRQAATRCSKLKAMMPVHLFGQTVDMSAYLAMGEELGVPIIEDAAQAIGSRDGDGQPAGSRGLIGCFSFFPSKNLGSFGDAGILTTNDADLAERMKTLRVHGSKPKYYHKEIGFNSRLDAIQAAILRVKLRHLEVWHEGRRENAETYDGAFAAAGAATSAVPLTAGGFPLRTPQPPSGEATHIYNQYVIRVPSPLRDSLRQHLQEQGIGTEIYYPVPLHLQECFAYLGYTQGDLPESESAARETLALPIYPELTDQQLAHVTDTIVAYIGEHACASKA
ncbi:MAG: DegT/DnrJ/EryC1/StrS family aminotransferase [Phycisphaerales bacterium]